MWIFTRNGFIGLAEHPQEGSKLIIQTQTREEIEQVVHLLDQDGSKHEIEQAMDGFCRFQTTPRRMQPPRRSLGWSRASTMAGSPSRSTSTSEVTRNSCYG